MTILCILETIVLKTLLMNGTTLINGTNQENVLKSKDITLPTKVCRVKAMVFAVVTEGCESWTVKKAECQRTDAFKLCCYRRCLRVPWRAKRSNQSILREMNPLKTLEGLMLKLKLQYFGHLMWRANSLEKTLMMEKIEGRKGEQQRVRWLDSIADSVDMTRRTQGDGEGQGGLVCYSP